MKNRKVAQYPAEQQGILFDIQRFAVHDGPGIRTTVFFKGCTCRCGWCHNPESLSVTPELEFHPSRCIGCGKCFQVCTEGAHTMEGNVHRIRRDACTGCRACVDTCYAAALVLKGRNYSVDEVMETLVADHSYYKESGGGVTLSGGEPAMQSAFAIELLKACKSHNLHTALQTAGNYDFGLLEGMLPYLDLVIYDVKGFSPTIYSSHIQGNRERMLGNLAKLDPIFQGRIVVRTPCVGTVNATSVEIEAIARHIQPMRRLWYYQLLPYHGLAKTKYAALDIEFTESYATPPVKEIALLEDHAARYVPVYSQARGFLMKRSENDEKHSDFDRSFPEIP